MSVYFFSWHPLYSLSIFEQCKIIKIESLCSSCLIKFWLFLMKNDDFYIKPKRNSRMAQAWDQGELSPWLFFILTYSPLFQFDGGIYFFFLLTALEFQGCWLSRLWFQDIVCHSNLPQLFRFDFSNPNSFFPFNIWYQIKNLII